jgi:capsular exopolysaccharide synthesis family protein
MDLRSYISILRRWLWLIMLCTIVAAGGAYLFSNQQTPIYAATSTIMLDQTNASSGNQGYQDILMNERLASTYAELLDGNEVQAAVINELGFRPQVLDIAVSAQRNTTLLTVVVQSEDASAAAFAANRVPEIVSEQQRLRQSERWAGHKASLNEEIARLEQEISDTQREIAALSDSISDRAELTNLNSDLNLLETTYAAYLQNLSEIRLAEAQEGNILAIVEPAQTPVEPVSPRILLNTLMAAVLGGMIGLGIGFVIEYLDDTIKNDNDIARHFDLGTLANIERMDMSGERTLVNTLGSRSPVIEAYRMLRTNIRFSVVDQELKSLVVTSPAPSEGKSTTAANLAIVLAQSGQKTILVDADLRRPVQHTIFQLPNKQGLTTALVERSVSVKKYLQPSEVEDLQVLTSGPQPPNPAELLGSQRMRELLNELEEEADIVIVDMPPVLAVTDSSLVAGAASGVLLVLRANSTTFTAARKAVDQLRSVHAKLLGVVLNGVQPGAEGYYYYYYPTEGNSGEHKKGPTTLGAKMRAMMLSVVPRRS